MSKLNKGLKGIHTSKIVTALRAAIYIRHRPADSEPRDSVALWSGGNILTAAQTEEPATVRK